MPRTPDTFHPTAPLNSCEATASYLGVSRGLVYQQAREGGLPALRIGSRLMIKTAPLLESLGLADADSKASCHCAREA